ncbi:MAG: class I SAM-dependent methyltransferase [Acidimicrobiia bacterium]
MSMVEAWDRQQEMYIGQREERFAVLLSAVEWHAELAGTASPTVVDLCCGPAAIGERLLRRLPGSRYVGVDIDPVLLELARQATATFGPHRAQIVEHDVADGGWLASAPIGDVDVVCSSTALHWLSADELDDALGHASRSLRPGGILLNADHLGYADAPSFTSLAGWIAARDAERAVAGGAVSWHAWWESARSDPRLAPLCARRDEVFPPTEAAPDGVDEVEEARASTERRPPLAGFIDAARRAGFVEVDTIWQRFDDRIVMAVKAASSAR